MARRLAQLFDDYVEEIAVGTRPLILVLLFGFGTAILSGVVTRLSHQPSPERTDGAALVVGLLVGALLALVARERRHYRAAITNRSRDVASLRRLTWQEFEIRIGELVRAQGYDVKERGGFERDGGIDAVALARNGKQIAIQAKQWREWTINELHVRAFDSVVRVNRYSEGWLVTCGRFTQPARAWAARCGIRLIDGAELERLLAAESPRRGSDAQEWR